MSSSRFLSADLRSIKPEDFKIQKPSESRKQRTEASAFSEQNTVRQQPRTTKEENYSQLERIIDEVIEAGRSERLMQTEPDPSLPAHMKELRHTGLSPQRISTDRRTFQEEEEFSFEERQRPIRTEPDQPRNAFSKKQKVQHFYLNLNSNPPATKEEPSSRETNIGEFKEALPKLSDVKVLMQCVLEKISRSYKGDLRQYTGMFSPGFVSEMRSFLIGATHSQKESSSYTTPAKSNQKQANSTAKKQPSKTESLLTTQPKPTLGQQQQSTQRRQQRYFSNQIKRVMFAPTSLAGGLGRP